MGSTINCDLETSCAAFTSKWASLPNRCVKQSSANKSKYSWGGALSNALIKLYNIPLPISRSIIKQEHFRKRAEFGVLVPRRFPGFQDKQDLHILDNRHNEQCRLYISVKVRLKLQILVSFISSRHTGGDLTIPIFRWDRQLCWQRV